MLPNSFIPLPDVAEMRQWDAAAIAFGLPEVLLMENAAHAALHVLEKTFGSLKGKRIWLVMGKGNNGGDAACLARLLLDCEALPLVIYTSPLRYMRGAAARHMRWARSANVPFITATRHTWTNPAPDIVVDGLLGTGFLGQLRPHALTITRHINSLRNQAFLLALDVPSGLNANTGLPSPEAVQAHVTITFEAAKPGLVLPQAKAFTGKLYTQHIGIPLSVRQIHRPACFAIDAHSAALFPKPSQAAYKGNFGHVLVIGGAEGMGGAAHLAARAALRSGAGLVSIASPADTDIHFGLPDIMTLPLANNNGRWPRQLPQALLTRLAQCNTLVIGPGMGRTCDSAYFLRNLLTLPKRPPAVIDADALWHVAKNTDLAALLCPDDIITPHEGEAARLLNCTRAEVQKNRRAALTKLSRRFACVCVLKGSGTLICHQQSPHILAPFDAPNLAIAGSGDVLAGCISTFLAQGQDSLLAAALGVLLHIEAGLDLHRHFPERGNLSSQTADALPKARARLCGTVPMPALTKLFTHHMP